MPTSVCVLPKTLSLHMYQENLLLLTGPLGSLVFETKGSLQVDQRTLVWSNPQDASFFQKMCDQVRYGNRLEFSLVGTGFKAEKTVDPQSKNAGTLVKLGYSHDFFVSEGSTWMCALDDPTVFSLYGIDSETLGGLGANLRDLRKPDPYKAKGVRIKNQEYTLREGKKK